MTRRQALLAGGAAGALMTFGGPAMLVAQTVGTRPSIETPQGQKMLDLYAKAVKAMMDPAINNPPQPNSWTFQSYIHGVPRNPQDKSDPAKYGGLRPGSPELKARVDSIYGNPAPGSKQEAWKAAALATWATCPHGSSWFLSWHRWYLYYFERICRSMSGAPDFQLPYWPYASNVGPSLQLPAAFRDTSNPLYFQYRGKGFNNPQGSGSRTVDMNSGGYMPYSQTDYGPALANRQFFPADVNSVPDPGTPEFEALGHTGRVEILPHDYVHGNVGGWMGRVPSAAGDPIFYVHHCQIDHLWATWSGIQGSTYNWGTSPDDPSQSDWTGQPASFVDETGKLVTVKAGATVNTSDLNYVYDAPAVPATAPAPVSAPSPAVVSAINPAQPGFMLAAGVGSGAGAGLFHLTAMSAKGVVLGGDGSKVELTPQSPPTAGVFGLAPGASAPAGTSSGGQPDPTTLELNGVKLLAAPPAPLQLFLNLPPGEQAELTSPYYVGTLNLFRFDAGTGQPMAHGAGGHGAAPSTSNTLLFDVRKVVAKLKADGKWDPSKATVTVTTLGADPSTGNSYVAVGEVKLLP